MSPNRKLVPRELLASRLDEHPGPIVIHAPAGYGKSQLVRQWLSGRPRVAWVTMDSEHNDPARLWQMISESVMAAGIAETTCLDPGLDGHESAARFIGGIQNSEPSTLVLDDLQRVTDNETLDSIDYLVRHAPETLQIVLIGRERPRLDLVRPSLQGDLLIVTVPDLMFTPEEVEEFLALNDVTPDDETLGVVEGWPGGLSLVIESRKAGRHPVVGSDRLIADYFSEQVMKDLEEDRVSFLLATSVLDSLTGASCDAVTGGEDSAAILEAIEDAGLPVIREDSQGQSYRYHPLFLQYLRARAERHPDQRRADHRRAAEWHAAEDELGGAIGHFLAAGMTDDAIDTLATGYFPAIERGDLASLENWLSLFSRRQITSDARLSVVEAWLMNFQQRHADADVAIENALRLDYHGPLPDGASSVEASAALIQAGFPIDDVGRMVDSARKAMELEGFPGSPWYGTVHMMLGSALLFQGNYEEAIPLLEKSAALSRQNERWLEEMGTSCFRAWAAIETGNPKEAEIWVDRAESVAEASKLAVTPFGGYVKAARGRLLAAQDEIKSAITAMTEGTDAMRGQVGPVMMAQCLTALAQALLRAGSLDLAVAACTEARAVLANFRDSGAIGRRLAEVWGSVQRARRLETDLSDREIEVTRLLARGLSKRQVAEAMFVSYNTVHTHTKAIYRKLGVNTREEVVAEARSRGLLDSDQSA